MGASIIKIIVSRNTICDNLVGFPKSGHILRDWVYKNGSNTYMHPILQLCNCISK